MNTLGNNMFIEDSDSDWYEEASGYDEWDGEEILLPKHVIIERKKNDPENNLLLCEKIKLIEPYLIEDLKYLLFEFIKPTEQYSNVLTEFRSNIYCQGYDGDKVVYWYDDDNLSFLIKKD